MTKKFTDFIKDRRMMLEHIWDDSVLKTFKHTFSDGSESMFYPSVKIEKLSDVIQLYETTSDIYNIVETPFVWYACEYGLKKLSDSICYTNIKKHIKKTSFVQSALDERMNFFESKKTITLNEIHKNYDKKFSTEIVQAY